MRRKCGVTVAYGGVHQAYQIALAAQERGLLDRFCCSIINAPGKWGGWLGRVVGSGRLESRTCAGLHENLVTEHPWPLLRQQLLTRFHKVPDDAWLETNKRFDEWASHRVLREESRVVVGTETCASCIFEAAGKIGALRVMDAPQWHQGALSAVLECGADKLGLRFNFPRDSARMRDRKEAEYSKADWLLVYSEAHRRSFELAGFGGKKFFVCPLWADPSLWFSERDAGGRSKGKLRVLFAGSVNLRKGIPFLVDAVRKLKGSATLTLVGAVGPELKAFIGSHRQEFNLALPLAKAELRAIYSNHDIFVLPSLVDAFGFVAMEAMACGLPVVVTENCGVPVPDPAWRVPVMNAEAIAERLAFYEGNRVALRQDGERAFLFARQYTPERYRNSVGGLLAELLAGVSCGE